MAYDVDLFVIGAGSGGTRAARIAAGHGAKVIIAEEFRVGGTCVIRGCVPKKLMVYASRFADSFAEAAGFGWTVPQPTFDWQHFVDAKEKEITRLSEIYSINLHKSGVEVVAARATLQDANTVLLSDGRTVTAKTILVATGGTPALHPDVPGKELAITSNEIFDLPAFPKSMLIVGGGYIAVEFASVFARLGTAVTLAVRSDNVLRGFDEDMRVGLRDALLEAGVDLRFGCLPTGIEKTSEGLRVTMSGCDPIVVDQVLVATGRDPHTHGLGLEKAGVKLGSKGEVVVDDWSRTNVPSIYAVGDVTDRVNLTPVAIREGHAFADTVFGNKKTRVDYSKIATAVFTTPEIGTVGMSEDEARTIVSRLDVYAATFKPMKATISGRKEMTIMKIIVDADSDKVLGVHVLGEGAGEMAQILGIVVKMGGTKADFDDTMAVHPTAAEELVTMRVRRMRHERIEPDPMVPGMADGASA